MSTTAIDRDRHRAEQPRYQRQRHRNRAEPNPRRPAYRFYTNPGTLPEGIRRVPHAALCTARLRPTRTRRAAGSQWVARPAVLSTARYAADRLRNVGLPNRQKPQGMSCEAMGEFRVSAPRGGLRTASIYAFLGWDLMRPGFRHLMAGFRLFLSAGIRSTPTASAADRAVLVELRRFLAVNHATGTLPGKRLARRRDGPLPAQE